MVPVFILLGGFLVGLAVGRWWSLGSAVLFGVAVASISEVEVSPVIMGIGYAGIAAASLCVGVAVRRALAAPNDA